MIFPVTTLHANSSYRIKHWRQSAQVDSHLFRVKLPLGRGLQKPRFLMTKTERWSNRSKLCANINIR